MIVAAVATMPSRVSSLTRTVGSILPQVDQLCVYLNGHTELPDCLKHPKITVAWGKDLGAAGKFFFTDRFKDGCYLTIDDDIWYPSDYTTRMSTRAMGSNAVICVYSRTFMMSNPTQYFEDSTETILEDALYEDRQAHVPGTGTAAFDLSYFSPKVEDIIEHNSADLMLGLVCNQRNVPVIAIARSQKWLISIAEAGDSIWNRRYEYAPRRSELLKGITWKLPLNHF